MPDKPRTYRPPGAPAPGKRTPDRRPSSSQRGYDARRYRCRRAFLQEHPLCVQCEQAGRLTPATVVDHVRPHRGDPTLFWDTNNHAPLCVSCHSRKTATSDGAFGNRRRG